MNDEELAAIWQQIIGEGAGLAKREKAVESILDIEFPGKRNTYQSYPCARCKSPTPHRTVGVRFDESGKKVQQVQCTVCETIQVVKAESFQENVETPDQTDFSILDDAP